MINLETVDEITGGSIGTFDVPCPLCGPAKSKRSSQGKPVLRIWRVDQNFATFNCARCETQGYARDNSANRHMPPQLREPKPKPQSTSALYQPSDCPQRGGYGAAGNRSPAQSSRRIYARHAVIKVRFPRPCLFYLQATTTRRR
jgi:hypothetical protein